MVKSDSGPRWRVFKGLEDGHGTAAPADVIPKWTETIVGADGKEINLHEKKPAKLKPGEVSLESWHAPTIPSGASYTIHFEQAIDIKRGDADLPTTFFSSEKKFSTPGNPYTLDTQLIDSVYPPQAHADYGTHVVFNDSQIPWVHQRPKSASGSKQPWLGLLVFRPEELALSTQEKQDFGAVIGNEALKQTATMGVQLDLQDFLKLDRLITQPVPVSESFNATIKAIFPRAELFNRIFTETLDGSGPISCAKFNSLTHVRSSRVNSVNGSESTPPTSFAYTVSPRAFPNEQSSYMVHAHLVSLAGIESMKVPADSRVGLISLYSWSYMCVHSDEAAVKQIFRGLGQNCRPLRPHDRFAGGKNTKGSRPEAWALHWAQSGYMLARYRLITGEMTMSVQRGFLSPVTVKPLALPATNNSSSLAIFDKEAGIIDLTFQLAWELGRTLALGDKVFSSALGRIRIGIHVQATSLAQIAVDQATLEPIFIEKKTALKSVKSATSVLNKAASSGAASVAGRWKASGKSEPIVVPLAESTVHFDKAYAEAVVSCTRTIGLATEHGSNAKVLFNELNKPVSSDYATILAWTLDKMFLHGIPFRNLVTDPGNLPKESIRSFYIDTNWYDCFIDGALSIANHFSSQDDAIRSALKGVIRSYLSSKIFNKDLPQVPKWGFFLRSEAVLKFPDLHVSADRADPNDIRAEVVKLERLEPDLVVVLFDRTPESGEFPNGIQIRPPEHQGTFRLGDAGDLTSDSLTLHWKKTYRDKKVRQDYSPTGTAIRPSTYKSCDPEGVFDFKNCLLRFPQFSTACENAMRDPMWPKNPESNVVSASAALVAAQLLSKTPVLDIRPQKDHIVPPVPAISRPAAFLEHYGAAEVTSEFVPRMAPFSIPLISKDRGVPPKPPARTPESKPAKTTSKIAHSKKRHAVLAYWWDWKLPRQPNINKGKADVPPRLFTKLWTYPKIVYPSPRQATWNNVHAWRSGRFKLPMQIIVVSRLLDTSKPATASWLEFDFPVGDTDKDLIAPFVKYPDSVNNSTPAALGDLVDHPHKVMKSGYRLPTVRFCGIGNRWTTKTEFSPSSPDSGKGRFIVQLVPNSSQDYIDLAQHPDVRIILSDVVVRTTQTDFDPFEIMVRESYIWKGGPTQGLGVAEGAVLCAINVDGSAR